MNVFLGFFCSWNSPSKKCNAKGQLSSGPGGKQSMENLLDLLIISSFVKVKTLSESFVREKVQKASLWARLRCCMKDVRAMMDYI